MPRYELRFAGFGGQGVITAGFVLACAASLQDGRYVAMTQSYGPESRGGACKADVIISDEPVDYPKTSRLNCLAAMSPDAYSQFQAEIAARGIVVYEESLVSIPVTDRRKGVSYRGVGAVDAAVELGSPLSANMVMLGSVVKITKAASPEGVRKVIGERFPRQTEVNLEAFETGRELAGSTAS
jgi:2-oxoglutarate ferredoxin oxidoreductase subunit gamma